MDLTVVIGQWQNHATARKYILTSAAQLAEVVLSYRQQLDLCLWTRVLQAVEEALMILLLHVLLLVS